MCHVLIATHPTENHYIKDIIATYFFNIILKGDAMTQQDIDMRVHNEQVEMLILDISDDPQSYLEYLTQFRDAHPEIKIIVISDTANFEHLQFAMRLGITDYLLKPLDKHECKLALHRAIIALNQISLLSYDLVETSDVLKQTAHQMMCYIHENYDQDIDLESLALYMHLNPTYLSRFFRQTVGITFVQYLRKYRVNQAQKLLKKSDLSIVDVGSEIGYNEPTHFSRVFKQETGMTPSQYRKLN